MITLWIVGRVYDQAGKDWSLVGVFDDEAKAIEACSDEHSFVGPVELNVRLPDIPVEWPNSYYPLVKKNPKGE